MTYRCVVLAGGVNRRPLYEGYVPDYKAVLELEGRPLIDYVLEALKGADGVGEIGVVGDPERLAHLVGGLTVKTGGDTLLESIKAALGFFPEDDRVLICTADLPMLRHEMVESFLDRCLGVETEYAEELLLAVVPRDHFVGAFGACAKNFNTFRDLALCHGNLALASPSILANATAMARVDELYASRTSPVRNALALGLDVGLAYLAGVHLFPLLDLATFCRLLSRRFGIGMVAVRSPFPEVAIDVDEPADLAIARGWLARVE